MCDLVIDARFLSAGGLGTFLKALLHYLAKKPCTLSLLAFEKDIPLLEKAYAKRCIPMKSAPFTCAEQRELPTKIPPCDLFFSPHINIPLFPIKAKKRVVVIHDTFHLDQNVGFIKEKGAWLFYKAATLLSDRVVTVSRYSQRRLEHHFPKAKSAMIYNGLLPYVAESQETAPPYLLAMGSLKKHKNLTSLLKAVEKLEIPLFLVGEKLKIDLPAHVFFTGHLAEEALYALYQNAALFIFPSLYEGFGYPPLEAMSAGCPTLTSACGSIPEICGDGVEYVTPSPHLLSVAIEKLLHNPKRQLELRERGKKIAAKYTLEKMGLAYWNLLCALL